ncbi:hypothetical protein ACOMHN_038459 [Nucella lapillus]
MALRALFFITLLLLADAQKWPFTGDCRPCECRYMTISAGRMRTVNCSQRGLSTIPANLPDDLMALDLSWNSMDVQQLRVQLCKFKSLQSVSLAFADITSLSDILKECSSVLELNLTGNRLAQVDSKTFIGLKNLRRLLGLEIESVVARDIFQHLTNLKDLDVIFHGISLPKGMFDDLVIQSLNLVVTQATSLPQRVFKFGQKTLNTLQLIGERIEQVDEDLLEGLRVLRKLYLVMPSVRQLPERFFHSQQFRVGASSNNARLANLQEVEMSGIRSLPAMLFNKLVTLETLQLKEIGSFPQIGFLAGAINLRTLLVTGSTLTSLPEGWFSQLYSLETLTFSGLQLERLHENAFRGLISLNYLDLSDNNLKQITAKMLMPLNKTLETLILRGNFLTEINKDVLGKLGSLRQLDVGENRLTNVYTNSFQGMTYLSFLYLNNNRLTSLPKDLFRDLTQLQTLSLSDNYLVEFPEAILQLERCLVSLDLASNELTEVPAFQLCRFVYLETINILGNKLHCDCSLLAFHQCKQTAVEGQCKSPQRYENMDINNIPMPTACAAGKKQRTMSNPKQKPPIFSTTQAAAAVDVLVSQSTLHLSVAFSPAVKTDVTVSGTVPTKNATIIRRLFTENLRKGLKNKDPALSSSDVINEDKSQRIRQPVSVSATEQNSFSVEQPNQKTGNKKTSHDTLLENQGQDSAPLERVLFKDGNIKPSKPAKNPESINGVALDVKQRNATVEPPRSLGMTSPASSPLSPYKEGYGIYGSPSENGEYSAPANRWGKSDSEQSSPRFASDLSPNKNVTNGKEHSSQTTLKTARGGGEHSVSFEGADSKFATRKTTSSMPSNSGKAEKKVMKRTSTASSIPSSVQPFVILDIDESGIKPRDNQSYRDPKEQEIDNGKNEKNSSEKMAFNFIISAMAALSVFGCAVLGIIFVRRWQQKGSYIISSEGTEMNNVDSGSTEAAAVLPQEKPKLAVTV